MKNYFQYLYWLLATLISGFLFKSYFDNFITAWLLSLMIIPAVLVYKNFYRTIMSEKGIIKVIHFIYLGILLLYIAYICVLIYFRYLFELHINKIPPILVNPIFLAMWLYFFISFEKLIESTSFKKKEKVSNEFLVFISNRKKIKLKLNQILYIESNNDEVWVHTTNQKFRTKMRISQWEKVLEPLFFVRIHRSYIVNTKQITKIQSDKVWINQIALDVSRKYKNSLKLVLK
ncbi:MAG: LytR/AlgR family response regulator transcription factor [Lutibacter sp.]